MSTTMSKDTTASAVPSAAARQTASTRPEPLDLSEKGRRDGKVISLDRRLYMKFTAFGDCADPVAAMSAGRRPPKPIFGSHSR